MSNPILPSPLNAADIMCIQVTPTDITQSVLYITMSNLGIKTLRIDDQSTPPWQNERLLIALDEDVRRHVIILATELNSYVQALAQMVQQYGYITFLASDELRDIAPHKILKLTHDGIGFLIAEDIADELSIMSASEALDHVY